MCHCQFPKGEIPAGPSFGHRTTRLCVCMLCGSRHSGLHVDLTYAIPLPIVKLSDGQYPSTTGEIIPRSSVPNRLSSVYLQWRHVAGAWLQQKQNPSIARANCAQSPY